MNKITVVGRVSQDVEVKDFNGRNCANFNVAAQNKNKDKNTNQYGTNFYRVTAWGQAADTASRFLKKGHRVGVVGDLVIRNYVGSDGAQHTAVEINNAEIELIETKAEAEARANNTQTAQPAAPAPVQAAPAQSLGFTPVEMDDGLPF